MGVVDVQKGGCRWRCGASLCGSLNPVAGGRLELS